MTLPKVLTVAALICFVLATFGVSGGSINLIAAGLACVAAATLV